MTFVPVVALLLQEKVLNDFIWDVRRQSSTGAAKLQFRALGQFFGGGQRKSFARFCADGDEHNDLSF